MKQHPIHCNPFLRCLLLAAFLVVSSHSALGGGARTWDGDANDGLWSSQNNWSNNTLPGANEAVFAGAFGAGNDTTISLGGNQSASVLTISTATLFSISDNTLTLSSGDIDRTATTGTTTINSGILLGGAGAWDIAGSSADGTLIVNGVIDDGASIFALDKTGNGKLVLNNANTFDGTLSLNAGILVLGNDLAAGEGTLDISGGTIEGAGGTRTIANNLTITANSTFGGDNLIFTGSFDQGGDRTYTVNNTTKFSGVISGNDNLIKAGSGTLILSGANSYSGTTTISAGTLRVGANAPSGNNGALGIDNTEVVFGVASGNDNASLLTDGAYSIGRNIRLVTSNNTDAGTRVLTLGGDTADNSVFSGNIFLGTTNQAGRGVTLTAAIGGQVTFSGVIQNPTGQSAGELAAAAALVAVNKNGLGTVVLSNANTYTGSTSISAGTLFANNTTGSATGTGAVSVISGGTLGGSGTIAPTGTNGISVSGVLSPGASVGSIGNLTLDLTGTTTGTVAMNLGSSFEFQLGAAGGSITSVGASDMLIIAGAAANDFAFNNNSVNFLSSGAVGYYKLFDTSNNVNPWTGLNFDLNSGVVTSGLAYNNLAGALTGTFIVGTATNGGNAGDIYFQVVPEPRAALLGGLGVLLLLRRRRNA